MPPSIFEGRPLPGPGEVLWTEEDRRWALALIVEEGEKCPGCGGQIHETTDPELEFSWHAEAVRCHRCASQQREMRSHHRDGDPAGLLVMARRRSDD